MVEMCTRHHPFHEVDHVGPDKIVQMVGRLIDYDSNVTLVVSNFLHHHQLSIRYKWIVIRERLQNKINRGVY